ncbi:PREDICTED: DNA demethylase ALKBH1 [Nicrophorus vespilloides]|uniref:DNA demethylase ALKBH1 n=1 Tax=Nicrophorus vespilloides TaxID=110193 RepID=A0ABM1MUE0_NICVS|nr:PREDICTED: DNA demethylase ALKBH1 [Nicrophorus vespilloides]
MFKESFKYYKSKKPPPVLDDVIDFHQIEDVDSSLYRKKEKLESVDCIHGLIPANEWEIYEIEANPGLIYIKNPFTTAGQNYWSVRCLRDFTKKPNKLNIDAHNLLPTGVDWWDYCEKDDSVLKKLRWATLGYHHDWDTKVYNEESKNEFPGDLNELCCSICNQLNFKKFNAEAAIINFYHLDSTLSGHTDHSEQNLEAPLLSFSFGSSAIFLLGGQTLDVKPTALMIRSGDVIIMSRDSRLSYHGVPRILEPSVVTWEDSYDRYSNYLKNNRINMNVRQVLNRSEKRLIN